MRSTTDPHNGQSENENCSAAACIQTSRQDPHVVSEEGWVVVSEVELGKQPQKDAREKGSCPWAVVRNKSGVLDEKRQINFGDIKATDSGNELKTHGDQLGMCGEVLHQRTWKIRR